MKRTCFYILGILVFLSCVFYFTSCKKGDPKSQQKQDTSRELSQKVFRMVENFKMNKSNSLKDVESFSIDSTIWYLEAALNATYARMNTTTSIHLIDSTFITIPLTQDTTVLLQDVYAAYDRLVDSLAVFYYSVPENRNVLLNDVYLASKTGNQLTIGMHMILSDAPTPNYQVWFTTNDNWLWGLGLGRCDQTYQGRDASTELTTHANYTVPIAPPGEHYTYINIESTGWIFPEFVPLPNGQQNPFGYESDYLFAHGGIDPEPCECLPYDVMNYYLENVFALSTLYLPQNKEIISYDIRFDFIDPNGYWRHVHKANFTYGVKIIAYYQQEDPPNL